MFSAHVRVGLASIATLLALGGAATAQPLKPNILIIFDTSASMLGGNGSQDGSPLCGGAGTNSYIYNLKIAMRQALVQVGTDEANFGLARFAQQRRSSTSCPQGHYVPVNCGLSTDTQKDNRTTAELTFGSWFSTGYREAFVVDPTRQLADGVVAQGTDFDPSDGNLAEMFKWLDMQEDAGSVPVTTPLTNPEIRAGSGGETPLGKALFYARLYFENYIKPNDPKAGCRKNIVILVTDGAEACDTNAGGGAFNATTCTYASGTPATYHPRIQACKLFRQSDIPVYVVSEAGLGNLNDTIAAAGGTSAALRADFTNSDSAKAALLDIIARSVPAGETCNGVDDNCNGDIDNRLGQDGPLPGVGDTCLCPGLLQSHIGKGMCRAGARVCTMAGQLACQGCVLPGVEICNGLDDDCDGEVDEDFPQVGTVCNNGAQGACFRTGTIQCTPQGGTACDAPVGTPGTEVCNGIDDNCNGDTDNALGMDGRLPGEGDDCGAQLGVCMGGTYACEGGALVCKGAMGMGTVEVCNGLDDDCDGTVDNGIRQGDDCACAPYDLATLRRGTCQPGKTICKGREPLDCEGCIGPRAEVCDGFDNNCDGQVDEGDMICPPGRVCLAAKCEILCKQGEFPCPSGFACDETTNPRLCRSLKCAAVTCPTGQRCKEETGECFDPCAGVTCAAPKYCVEGSCVDCTLVGCSDGKICKNGVCQERPCAGVNCGVGKYCDETGACVALCNPACGSGQRCVGGACQDNPCLSKTCASASQVCDPMSGECKENACALVGSCPVGQRCVPTTGLCKEDPCQSIDCGDACFYCAMDADGLGLCLQRSECKQKEIVTIIETVGGGCACSIGAAGSGAGDARGAGGGPLALLLVALAGALRTRRRRGC